MLNCLFRFGDIAVDDIEVVQGNCDGGTGGLVNAIFKLCYLRLPPPHLAF